VTRSRLGRRVSVVVGAAAIAWSCATGVAVSFTGYYNALLALHPGVFDSSRT
jgi:hypothetical protein